MKTPSALLTVLGAALAVALTGCSSPAVTTTSGPSVLPVATTSTLPPAPPLPAPTGTIGGVDVAISSQGAALLRPGGDPMVFTVALTNTTAADIPLVRFVVSFGHCACGYPGASIMPNGTMRMLDPVTNAWVDAPYVVEGTGTDYLNRNLVPPFVLGKGQTVTYQLEARLDANPDVTSGQSLVTVTIETPDARGHAASLPVTVEP